MTSQRKIRNGFTILEMAIVLLVISVLTASLVGPLTNYIYQRQVADTQKSLEEIKEALLGYAAANKGVLPGPAISPTNGEAKGSCGSTTECSGLVPWQTLGTPKADAWGKIFQYSVTPDYTTEIKIALALKGTKTICNVPDVSGINCDQALAKEVPVLVWSAGRRNFGTSEAGVALPNLGGTGNVDEIMNQRILLGNEVAVSRNYSEAGATRGEFDDQVIWISAPLLFHHVLAAGWPIPSGK